MNHEAILELFCEEMGGSALMRVVETRFASHIYCAESILKSEKELIRLFACQKMEDVLKRPTYATLKTEYDALYNDLIRNSSLWARIKAFVALEMPVRKLLRFTDGNAPNLAELPWRFERAERQCVFAPVELSRADDVLYHGLDATIQEHFAKRRFDPRNPLLMHFFF